MRKMEIAELRSIQLDILREIDAFCRKHGIRYFLCYGSLIGAIRHKGYIPWDDDIDISMPRPDYERFVREFSSSRFVLLDKSRDKNHPYLYGKVSDPETIVKENYDCPIEVGVNVDIFPIDGLPDDKKESDRLCEKLKKLRRMLEVKRLYVSKDRPLWKNILHVSGKLILLPVPDCCILRHIGKLQQRYPYENASWVADLNFGGKERRVPKSLFERTVEVDFEGGKFWAPEGYDTWLRSIFGDYMQLPPEEKRVSNHFFEVYHK